MTDKTTTTTIPALLPCPFCGGKAEVHEEDGHNRYAAYWVGCNGCGCATDTDLRAGEAVSAWNRRSAPPPAPTAPSARFATPDNVVAELWRHLAVWGTADPLSAPPLWLYEAMDKALTLLPAAPPAAQPVAWMCEDLILPNDKPLFTQVREHAERRTEAMHEGKPVWRVTPLYAAAPGAQPAQDMTETAKRIAWEMRVRLSVCYRASDCADPDSLWSALVKPDRDACLSAARAAQPAGEVVGMPPAVAEVTEAAARYTKREGTDFIGRMGEAFGEIDGCLDGGEVHAEMLEEYRSAVSDLAALSLAQMIMADEQIAALRSGEGR